MDQAILDLFGEYGSLVLAVIGVFAALATLLPAPGEKSGKVYCAFYKVVNWLGANFGHASNAGGKKGQ